MSEDAAPFIVPDRDAVRDRAMRVCYGFIDEVAHIHPEGAAWGAYNWLAANEAGLPSLAFTDDSARRDAFLWSETATPAELECYAVAALTRLSGAPFASRQIKRFIANLWRRMSPAEQTAFKEWINK